MNVRDGVMRRGADDRAAFRRRWLEEPEDSDSAGFAGAPLLLAGAQPAAGDPGGGGGGTLPPPTLLSISATVQSQVEGSSGFRTYQYYVSRSGATGGTTTVNWAVSGVASGPYIAAASGGDFANNVLPAGTLTFAPGEALKAINVLVKGDTTTELDEKFQVTLSGASSTTAGGTLLMSATAEGTILTDEESINIRSIATSTRLEQTSLWSDKTELQFEIFRAGPYSGTDNVRYSVLGFSGPGYDAASGGDFFQPTTGQVGFPSATVGIVGTAMTTTISIFVNRDATQEADEGFVVTLSNPTGGAGIAQGTALGLILDDDSIKGTSGNDVLLGITPGGKGVYPHDGSDVFLIGGGGLDTIYGLEATDKFWFLPSALGPAGANTTTIWDFSRAAGEVLDLSRIDAKTGGLNFGDQAFTYIGTAAFGGVAGQLRWSTVDGFHVIQGDVNGDSVADLTVRVAHPTTPDVNWFVL